jgi:hypothetical protein
MEHLPTNVLSAYADAKAAVQEARVRLLEAHRRNDVAAAHRATFDFVRAEEACRATFNTRHQPMALRTA